MTLVPIFRRTACAAVAAAVTSACSSSPVTLTPAAGSTAAPRPTAGATASASPSPAATATATAAATATATPAPTSTPTAPPSTAAACGTVFTVTPDEAGGQLSAPASSACASSVTFDYPSFMLSPATTPDPYVFRIIADTTLDTVLQSGFGAVELCSTPPGVFYAGVALDAGPSGPQLRFGSTGADGIGGTIVSPALTAGRTYTVYGALTAPAFENFGSTTFTATASAGSGSISGGTLSVTPPSTTLPSGATGEVEVCYPS